MRELRWPLLTVLLALPWAAAQPGEPLGWESRRGQTHTDELGQTHTRYDQTYRGLRVWGGQAIEHRGRDGRLLSVTRVLHEVPSLDPTPSLGEREALAAAAWHQGSEAAFAAEPKVELVVFPRRVLVQSRPGRDATAYDQVTVRHHLAYAVSTRIHQPGQTLHRVTVVDAHSGAVLMSYDDLHTAGAAGTGRSQYSGTVALNTNRTATGYELRDTTRGTGGRFGSNAVTSMANGTSGDGTVMADDDNLWGDGQNYQAGAGAANAQTAGVDAAYGAQATWDYFLQVHGRHGIDGTGTATFSRVHYDKNYDNAFWDDDCFCMTYGDGSMFKVLTALDVAGHEMSHGVCSKSAGLVYAGESGGLNEANSDIHGAMVEFHARGGSGAVIGNSGGNWTIGEQLATPAFNRPLRYMYKPSLDGRSADAWSPTLSTLDVHLSSGPMNRCFYFLSQGASSDPASPVYSAYLPQGMAGLGNDKAARIWYRALTVYLTAMSQYKDARSACLKAAGDLYGASSKEAAAVQNAFAAINVGRSVLGL